MKYLKQFGIILLITCVGEIIKLLVPLPIPSSIYGLVLMFFLLVTHVIPVDSVRNAAEFLIVIMPVMFIPAATGLINYWPQLRPILIPTLAMIVIVTLITMAITGKTAMYIINRSKQEDGPNE